VIGKGGFGKVFKVTEKKTKNVYALKVISKARVLTKKSVPSVMNEREILSKLLEEECEFIVNMRCSFQDRDNLYLLMDLLDGGDLRYYINRSYVFAEEQISNSLFTQGSSCGASWRD
jgi:serine/threonine protein kinase